MFCITAFVVLVKVFLVEGSYGESLGVYMKPYTDEETGLESEETDFFGTFLFEMVAISSYVIIYYVTHLIKIRVLL
jgi:hypothetical protein